jgi:predicted ArsR family transcriptional regulator
LDAWHLSTDLVDRLTGMDDSLEPIGTLSALDDPTRRSAYDYVCAQGRRIGRDEVATALGIGRTLAAYHLDRLAKAGLLSVAYARRSRRTGPGAGRPAKLYERSERELSVSVPPRDYGLAARLLAHAAAHDEQGRTGRALRAAAESLGREIAASAPDPPDLDRLLRERGYEPYEDDAGVRRLRNCPFHAVAQSHPEVVCEMNLSLLRGLIAGLDADVQAVLEPGPGRCCVAIKPVRESAG